jgi:hypothetical protein
MELFQLDQDGVPQVEVRLAQALGDLERQDKAIDNCTGRSSCKRCNTIWTRCTMNYKKPQGAITRQQRIKPEPFSCIRDANYLLCSECIVVNQVKGNLCKTSGRSLMGVLTAAQKTKRGTLVISFNL